MEDEKKQLEPDERLEKVTAGWDDEEDDDDFEPYNDPRYPISCPRCKGKRLEYHTNLLSRIFTELEYFHCLNCGHYFRRYELDGGGSSGEW